MPEMENEKQVMQNGQEDTAAEVAVDIPAASAGKKAEKSGSASAGKQTAAAGKAVKAQPVKKTAGEAAKKKSSAEKSSGISAGKTSDGKVKAAAVQEKEPEEKAKPAKKPLSKKAALRRKKKIHRIIRRSILCLFSLLGKTVTLLFWTHLRI